MHARISSEHLEWAKNASDLSDTPQARVAYRHLLKTAFQQMHEDILAAGPDTMKLALHPSHTEGVSYKTPPKQRLDPTMAKQLDIVARLQILEGVAGVPEGTWADGRALAGLRAAKAHFAGKPLDALWLSDQDTGLFRKAAYKFFSVMNKLPSEGTTEDLLQGLMAGIGLGGAKTKRMFNSIGDYLKDKVLQGGGFVEAGNSAAKFVLQHAGTLQEKYWAKKRSGPNQKGQWNTNVPLQNEGVHLDIPSFQGLEPEEKKDFLTQILYDPTDTDMETIRNLVFKDLINKSKNEQQKEVVTALLSVMSDDSIPKTRVRAEVAFRTGYSVQGVGKLEDKMFDEWIPKIVSSNPSIRNRVDSVIDRSEIGAAAAGFRSAKKRSPKVPF